jgi:hypothetical protein
MSLAMIAGELDEGPMVAMIFVRLGMMTPLNSNFNHG